MDTRLTKSYYKIREVAEMLNVPQSTLRFWEKEFPEVCPRRSAGNQRYFTPGDVELLQIIHFLLHTKGMKMDAAKEYLKHNKSNISKKMEIVAKLKEVREDLAVLLNSLNLRGNKIDIRSFD